MLEGRDQRVEVIDDPIGKSDEWLQSTAEGPIEPVFEQLQSRLVGELEDQAEVFLQKIGTVEGLIHPLDPGRLGGLASVRFSGFFQSAQRARLTSIHRSGRASQG